MEDRQEVLDWIEGFFSVPDQHRILIGVLLAMQETFGYLPKVGIQEVARRMGLSPANAYGVATFYNQFRLVPPGKHAVKVCMGTACHIKQAGKIMQHWERNLGIRTGEVTGDLEYSLDRVACVGCCTLAPVTSINDEVIGEMSPSKVDGLLLQHRIARQGRAGAS